MSYRNDHDAALARIDALEAEVARLEREHDRDAPQQPKRRSAPRYTLGVALAATIAAGAIYGQVRHDRHVERPQPEAITGAPVAAPIAIEYSHGFEACRAQIKHPVGLTAASTDPRAGAHDVHVIEATQAPCRAELLRSSDHSLARWTRAENELAGDISRIVVYYEHDPYHLDGYTTAEQLWKEYDADIVERDAALIALYPNS